MATRSFNQPKQTPAEEKADLASMSVSQLKSFRKVMNMPCLMSAEARAENARLTALVDEELAARGTTK